MKRDNLVFAILVLILLAPLVAFSASMIGNAVNVISTRGNVQADLNRVDANLGTIQVDLAAKQTNLGTLEALVNANQSQSSTNTSTLEAYVNQKYTELHTNASTLEILVNENKDEAHSNASTLEAYVNQKYNELHDTDATQESLINANKDTAHTNVSTLEALVNENHNETWIVFSTQENLIVANKAELYSNIGTLEASLLAKELALRNNLTTHEALINGNYSLLYTNIGTLETNIANIITPQINGLLLNIGTLEALVVAYNNALHANDQTLEALIIADKAELYNNLTTLESTLLSKELALHINIGTLEANISNIITPQINALLLNIGTLEALVAANDNARKLDIGLITNEITIIQSDVTNIHRLIADITAENVITKQDIGLITAEIVTIRNNLSTLESYVNSQDIGIGIQITELRNNLTTMEALIVSNYNALHSNDETLESAILENKTNLGTLEALVNTKAGKTYVDSTDEAQASAILLKQSIADMVNYYTKTTIDTLLNDKANTGEVALKQSIADMVNYYTITATDILLSGKATTDSVALKQDISDMVNYYTKTAMDLLLSDKAGTDAVALKANSSDVYTKTSVDLMLTDKANTGDVALKQNISDMINYYTKTAVDLLLTGKADTDSVYTKTSADLLFATISNLGLKANSTDVYTKAQVDSTMETYVLPTNIKVASIEAYILSLLPVPTEAGYLYYDTTEAKVIWKMVSSGTAGVTDHYDLAHKGTLTHDQLESSLFSKASTSYVNTTDESLFSALGLKQSIADMVNYYTKTSVDTLLTNKADTDSVYTKSAMDILLALKASVAYVNGTDEASIIRMGSIEVTLNNFINATAPSIYATIANLDTHETELTNIKLNLDTHESYLLALNNNIQTHETAIIDLQLNIDTLEALALANKANLDTHELLLNAKLNITAMTTHENLLTAHGIPSRAGNGAKYLYLSTDENSLIWSPLTMPDLSPYAIKATTDSLEINFLAHKDATSSAHAASAISYTDTYTLGVTTLQTYADTVAVWLTSVQNRVASIEVALYGGSTGEVFTRTTTGYIWATSTSGVTDHLLLTNIGVLTHSLIDTYIGSFEVALEKIFPAVSPTDSTAFGYKTATGYGYYPSSSGGDSYPSVITRIYGGTDLVGVSGEVGFKAGTNVTITRTDGTIEISATGSSSGGKADEDTGVYVSANTFDFSKEYDTTAVMIYRNGVLQPRRLLYTSVESSKTRCEFLTTVDASDEILLYSTK